MKNNSIPQNGKRAAIYIRTSTERQAEKVSPEAQEADCKALCERHGYTLVEVYRDTEKYRVRGRMVEPSGTRSDRPQFLRMLADNDAGNFDTLIAWREDRLYRGVTRAVIELKDRIKSGALTIEIVNGGFNAQTMEVLAWAAGVENQARVERTAMGMSSRLAAGKVIMSNPPYGVDYVDGMLYASETEAVWVQSIWRWFGENVSVGEIRRRLIAADAPQKSTNKSPRKHKWSIAIIMQMVNRDEYYAGTIKTKWNGQTYEAPFPKLIDAATYQAVQERRARWKAFPAGNLKAMALVAGSIYCAACGTRMMMVSTISNHKKYFYYRCQGDRRQTPMTGCAGRVRQPEVDKTVWERIGALLSDPEQFEEALQTRINQLKTEDADAESDATKLENQLDDVLLERQRVIGFARKGLITEDDLETQLLTLTMQERTLRRELTEKRLLSGNRTGRLLKVASVYRQKLKDGMEVLNAEPQTENQAARQFEFRRQYIEALVTRVWVQEDKSISIELELDLSPASEDTSDLLINSPASARQ